MARAGSAATANASRYLQQLAKHWAHKNEVTFDPARARIVLPIGEVGMTADADRLSARLRVGDDGDLDRLQTVFESHINRFAFREGELRFEWTNVEDDAGDLP